MKDDQDTCSTGSSLSGIYKSIFKSQTPVCMFYFSHPFGIATPSSANNTESNVEKQERRKPKRGSKYTTTTYLVTEIQKNHSDEESHDDESELRKSSQFINDRELLPWPKNLMLPPLIQMIEKKHGKKLTDIDAILKQVRKQAWNTPKSHHSHSFWSRGSSVSSDDFSSLASPDSSNDKSQLASKSKFKRRQHKKAQKMDMKSSDGVGSGSSGSGKKQPLMKRRYSVPEIIMRKYSLAQQKSYEESVGIYSTATPISKTLLPKSEHNHQHQQQRASGQSSINKRPILSQTPPQHHSHTASPIKYFIPFSPQASSTPLNTNNSLYCTSNSLGGSGGFFHSQSNNTNSGELSMRKQTLLRRMWSREFQHTKYSGSWSPPLRKSTHQPESRLKKFNTLPEFLSSSCEKCKELGVLSRDNFTEEDLCDLKEDKSQQTDFDYDINANVGNNLESQQQNLSSASSSASTIIQSSNCAAENKDTKETKSAIKNSSSNIDANGNSIHICMKSLEPESSSTLEDGTSIVEDMLEVEIDGNNNAPLDMTTTSASFGRNGDKYLKKQYSTQLDDEGYHPSDEQHITTTSIHYRRLREDKLSDAEIDQYISQMLIDNLNNVIRTVNENLQANGENNLVKIDYSHHHQLNLQKQPSNVVNGEEMENRNSNNNSSSDNKLVRNQHEISIQMRNAKNGDTGSKNRNSNEAFSPASAEYVAVERDIYEKTDVNSPKLSTADYFEAKRHYFSAYADKSVSERSTSTELSNESQLEVAALINTGTSYPILSSERPSSITVPRFIGPKTESMEVNPSSSSAQEDDEFEGMPDSDEDDLSDVDSLDDVVTIKAKRLNEIAHAQHKKAQALFRQTHLKGQAFFVPIVDPEIQPIDEHVGIVADAMPEKIKERLVLRQRRRDLKRQKEMKIKQWRMQEYIERKMEQMNVVNEYLADLTSTNSAFKVIPLPQTQKPIEATGYKRAPNPLSGVSSGWMPKPRDAVSHQPSSESTSDKSVKSKKLRNNIANLESYKIDSRGNMQVQAAPKAEKVIVKPKIKRSTYTSISEGKRSTKAKIKTPSEIMSRKSVPSSKRTSSLKPPSSSASSIEITDARRRSQVMKDVQQMSIYKNDLTPDPDSGPSRKMWKTEIQEGDKHIEILEIVECVDGNTLAQQAPEHLTNNFTHHLSTQNHHNFYNSHPPSSSTHHPMFVNKTFSVKTTGFDDSGRHNYASKIPIPVYRRYRQPFAFYDPSSPSNQQSSSTEAEESLTSAGSSIHSSKVDRMIANLLLEALKSPDEIGIEFVNSPKNRRVKRRSQSPSGIDSSSTGYYTGDSSSRRSASNSAGKYQHRFEVIPEEKSSFSVDSSNDDFIEDEEEEKIVERINTINDDWKSKKNLQNNDIKTRNITPQRDDDDAMDEDENEKENEIKEEEEKSKNISANNAKISPTKKSPMKINNNLKPPSSSSNKSTKSSPVKSPALSIKSGKSSAESSPAKQQKSKDASDAKSFIAFTEVPDENQLNEDSFERREDTGDSKEDYHHNLIHHFMSSKIPPSSASPSTVNNNNHFHYHLYQYQNNHCCFQYLDHSKTSSTVCSTAASNENYSSSQTQSAVNSCPLGVTDVSLSLNTQHSGSNKNDTTEEKSEVKKLSENTTTRLHLTGDSPNMFNCNKQLTCEATPSSYDEHSRTQTASEKIIEIELSNETYRKPQDEQDDCSCTKKYLPYKVNEKNVWQVYETSDCKYIHSKMEIDEVFQPPDTGDSTLTSENSHLLHSRSNFSNQIICHAINHETNHNENALHKASAESSNVVVNTQVQKLASESVYTPTFNIKPLNLDSTCHCNEDEMESEKHLEEQSQASSSTVKETKPTGKLLNRPKAINNISRDQVKPVEKEVEDEITRNGANSYKILSKPIRLPSPNPKTQRNSPPKRNNSYEDNSQSSTESISSNDLPICDSPSNSKSAKNNENTTKEKSKLRKEKLNSSLVRSENKSLTIPNIHQGWSVTVAGTHPDLAPDVEMKISFPKAKPSSQSSIAPPIAPSECSESNKPDHEVFYYRNNQLMPGPSGNESGNIQMPPYEPRRQQQQYYNHRRSLSLARVDSGLSGMVQPKSYKLPNLHVPRSTARKTFKQVECTTISASKTIIPNRRALSLDHGNRRLSSIDSHSQASHTPSEMLSVVGESLKRTTKPKVKTMSERDLTKRHSNCFTRSNGFLF